MENFEITKSRQYDIDWLRILLISSVFLFHVGMVFNTWDWHVKNNELVVWLKYPMRFLHYWRMPLLFLISGAGTYFALGHRSATVYIRERTLRLLVPLLFGIVTLIPVQVYLDTNLTQRNEVYKNLFEFYPHFFEGIYPKGNFSWHHLYFIAYLFLICMIFSIFITYFRSEKYKRLIEKLGRYLRNPLRINIFIIPVLISQIILRKFFPDETHDLVNDWASFAFYALYFLFGYLIASCEAIRKTITEKRRSFLVQTIVATTIAFSVPPLYRGGYITDERTAEIIRDIAAIVLTWTCSMAALGYAARYLNNNSSLRAVANEAIYPFYLLHQPIIVIAGFYIVKLNLSSGTKALLIITSSLIAFTFVYWYIIRRLNVLRLLFGLKLK